MTASAQLDGRIDFKGTLAALVAAFGSASGFPAGTQAYTTDFGLVIWNGTYWENNTAGTIAASTTVTQAAGTPLTDELCNITSTAAGAVTLPPSVPGNIITVHNISTFNVSVFPNAAGTTTEKINALGANAAIVLATNTSTSFTCAVAGQWYTVPRVPS
jgi:hypothetical protein